MKFTTEFIFYISLFVTLLMGGLSYSSYLRHKEKEFLHLTEFWGAMFFNGLVGLIFQRMFPQFLALSMVGWIWPLRAISLVLEDISLHQSSLRWQYILIGASAFITVALAGYGYSFTTYTLPLTIGVAAVGLLLVADAKKHTPKNICTSLHWGNYLLMGAFFVSRLAFPFWRIHAGTEFYGPLLELILNIGFAGVSLSVYMELMKTKHEKEMDHLLKERNDRLIGQSKYSELGMMSAGIAHEINNPLAVIQARTTQLLRIYRNPEKQQDLADGLQQILYTSERINRTIQGIREFVHQDEKAPVSEIELQDLVDDVLAFCGQRMKNHGVNLRFYGLENYSVVGNKIQLEQIILNLLNNAFDAIEFLPDKWIEMSCLQTDDRIQIYVKDSGSGIPKEVAARIMEPFFSTKDLGKGTGMGLALARGIAEKHRGSLKYVADAPHTTFLLELPKKPLADWGLPLH